MIRELKIDKIDEIEEVNKLLSKFNYRITLNSFNNNFLKCLIYYDYCIKGIVVYDLLYDRIEIEYIIVDDNAKRQGIGSMLLKEIEKNNINNITLEVRESNNEAINFYKKNGFEIASIRKNYYGDENGYLMLKELGE